MHLTDIVRNYINQPYPLWEYEATEAIVNSKWAELKKNNISGQFDYCTSRCINDSIIPLGNRFPIFGNNKNETVYLEAPSFEFLQNFYDEHGLCPCSEADLASNAAITKLKSAFAVIDLVNPAFSCVTKLVRSIQILRQEDKEFDVSYSHPKIPFSIFASVCQDNSMISNLRVAESILHESMHLKLTMIENTVPLVKLNTRNLYFSPWREEKRPAQGVLHGSFVFSAILHFYKLILSDLMSLEESNYVLFRIDQISEEIRQLKDFHLCDDLTKDGAILTKNLLPLN